MGEFRSTYSLVLLYLLGYPFQRSPATFTCVFAVFFGDLELTLRVLSSQVCEYLAAGAFSPFSPPQCHSFATLTLDTKFTGNIVGSDSATTAKYFSANVEAP